MPQGFRKDGTKLGFQIGNKIMVGRKISDIVKEKIRKSLIGKKQSEETIKKRIGLLKGNKNPNWRGGIAYYPYPEEWKDNLRESIRQRDNYTCQECGINQEELVGRFKQLDIHHIDYNKNNLNPDNLITLCRSCHMKTNYNRDYWINYFRY